MTILGIGTVVVDHVVELPGFPVEDTKAAAGHHWRQLGGPVPVAFSTAAFYGSRCHFLGRWANDEHGRLIERTLAERQVVFEQPAAESHWSTGFAHVWVDTTTGSRTIAFSRGEFPVPDEADIDEAVLANCRLLHLDGWAIGAALKAATIVKRNGGRVVLDAGSVKPGLKDLLPFVDVLIASALFRKSHFGTETVAATELRGLVHGSVIATDGANGASWITPDEILHEPALAITAVDTNGAGDIFSGSVLHGLDRNWSRGKILKFANRVAGHACTQRGNDSWPADAADS